LSCECNLLCDGVNGVVEPDFPVLRSGVGGCGGGEGLQFGVVYPVDKVIWEDLQSVFLVVLLLMAVRYYKE
jgi:hypothetical protein